MIIRERNPMNAPLANSIVLSMSKKLRPGAGGDSANQNIFQELPPEPVVPSNICSPLLTLFDVPPIELARQLTIIEFARFKAIKLWSRSGSLKDKAPNVLAMINAFNEFCTWVATSIVTQERIKDRVKTMEYFVRTAKHLYRLKNFNTLVALLAGLRSESVYRLTFTRAEISRKSEKMLENLNRLMRADSSYKTYREALGQSAPPCIPYLGVHLSDLTFIEEGNPDMIEGLINFTRRLVFRVISELSRYQQTAYNLHPVPQIVDLLKREGGRAASASPPLAVEDLYRISERREPRGAERKDIL
ncbi:aimless RasGEF, putative [Acanthamoeba castellanii str. Neff]|uniref:Aimless RasGEF, putative n=1 Tax=Acanthamoeba castellanii (strain ATCC 30010 / Neff) TaxID=1257118 RepID=L8HJ64_ACACF|nr:aimless RasGEF, putative [Acanthamoeba castellanii str. Neff]ELR24733.1 aimless RasGEF, putative [Acanthamoeba castellanii str. Neff]